MWRASNRALLASRQSLRSRDICVLKVSDVLGLRAVVRGPLHISEDGTADLLDIALRQTIYRYLISHFHRQGDSLTPLNTDLVVLLFPTEKRKQFNNNKLAQQFSLLDKALWQRLKYQKVNTAPRCLHAM